MKKKLFLLSCALFFTYSAQAQVNVIEAPANYQFIDMGFDAVNGEVAMVGQIVEGNNEIPTVFELNATGDGFTAQTLANLPGATGNASVLGISSDAIRIAGSSSSSNSINNEGTTWLRATPNVVEGIGFIEGFTNNSTSTSAWSDGIVGNSSGLQLPIIWDITNGIQILPGTDGGLAEAQGVSADGEISCLLYTSPSPRDQRGSRMPSSA